MSYQEWVSLITPSTPQASGAGAALNTATTATISPVTGSTADVAQVNAEGAFQGWQIGFQVRFWARGYITTTATSTTATFLAACRVGNTGATYITLANTAAITTGTTVYTGLQWEMWGLARCTNVATSGNTVATQAMLYLMNNATAPAIGTAQGIQVPLPSASGEQLAAVDTTQVQGFSIRATLAGANATIQLTQWMVEACN